MALSMGDIVATMRLDISQFSKNMATVANDLQGLGKSDKTAGITKLGETFVSTGKQMTKAITLPVVGAGAAAVKITSDFQSSMSKVSALSGATGQDLEDLTAKARAMGKDTIYSASEAADALGYMALAGWDTKQMGEGLEPVLKLAGAAGMDLAKTSDIVTDTLTMFGMEAGEATRLTDVLAYTQANANTNVEQLGDALVYCGASANAMGYDIETTSALLGKLADSGIKGSVAGTTLNSMFRDMKAKAEDGAIAIGKKNVSIVDANGNYRDMTDILADVELATDGLSQAEKDQALSAIWGTEALKGVNAIMEQGVGTVKELDGALRDCKGTAEEQYRVMNDNLKGAWANLKSSMSDLAITIGNMIIPSLQNMVEWFTGVVDKVNEFAQAHPMIAQVALAIAGVVAAVGPLLVIFGTLAVSLARIVDGVKLVQKGFALLKTGFLIVKTLVLDSLIPALGSLWAFMLANPITLVIAAVAALVAAFVYCWNNVDGFKEFWVNAWETIKTACSDAWNAIVTWCGNAWDSVVSWWQGLPEFFSGIWESFKQGVADAWNSVTTTIQTICGNIWNFFTSTIPNWISSIVEWWNQLPGLLGSILGTVLGHIVLWGVNAWNYLSTNVPIWITGIVTWFGELPGKIWQWLSDCISKMATWGTETWNKAKETGTNVLNAVTQFFSQLPGKIWSWLSDVISKMGTWASNTASKAREAGSQVISTVTQFFSQLPGKIWSWLSNAISKMATWVSQMASKGREAASQTISNVVSGFTSLPGKLVNIGKSALEGLWSGMSGMMSSITNKVKDFCGNLVSSFKNVLKINSPSKVMRDVVGKGIVEGIEVGMENEEEQALNMARGISEGLIDTLSTELNPEIMTTLSDMNISRSIEPIGYTNTNTQQGGYEALAEALQGVNNEGGVSIYLNIGNFNNNRKQDVDGLMREMVDVVKNEKLADTGERIR